MPNADKVDADATSAKARNGAVMARPRPMPLRIALLTLSSAATLAFAALVILGFLGGWHPAGDSFAAFRVPLALLLVPAALLSAGLAAPFRRRVAVLFCVLAALGVAALAEPTAARFLTNAAPEEPVIRVYQKNLLFFGAPERDALLADVARTSPDVIALQEVDTRRGTLMGQLAPSHPHQLMCHPGHLPVAILSRLPIIDEYCGNAADNLSGIKVETAAGPLWVISIHVVWPWPFGQARQVERIAPQLAMLDAPVVLAGDFNMVPWSWAVRRLERATQTYRPWPVAPTFELAGAIGLPIDQVLVPRGWAAAIERRPRFRSDHFGLLVTAGPR